MRKMPDRYIPRHLTITTTWAVLLSSVLSVVTAYMHEFIWKKVKCVIPPL